MNKWLLPGILLVAFILRVYGLSSYPVGFTPDEASFGYDAYSILHTGKDQWGNSFPLVLESFGVAKPLLYAYLAVPSIAIFGLTEFAVRLPNALLGALAVFVVFLLTERLFNKRTALFAAGLLAVSPWHTMLSRGAFEANLTAFFLPLGLWLLLKGAKEQKFLYLGSLVLGLNLFSYHSAKLVTPLALLLFAILYKDKFVNISKKHLARAAGIFVVFLGLMAYSFTLGAGARASDVSIFRGIREASAEYKVHAFNLGINPTLTRVLYNKYKIPVSRFLKNYVEYLSPQYLFTSGPAEATYGMIPGRGVIYWFELAFIFGFLAVLFRTKNKKALLFLLGWLLLAPIPAALTTGRGYAANRAASMLPVLQIILAIGAVEFLAFIKRNFSKDRERLVLVAYAGFSLLLLLGFLSDYFLISPARNASAMLYGNMEASRMLVENYEGREIVVSRGLSEPQIFIAFVNKWDPVSYQEATKNWDYKKHNGWVDQIPEYTLENYTFKDIKEKDIEDGLVLMGRPDGFPYEIIPTYTINYQNGEPAVWIHDASEKVHAKAN